MAWVAVDKNGEEWIYNEIPERSMEEGYWQKPSFCTQCVYLPTGTIKKLIGLELTWNDDPVELI